MLYPLRFERTVIVGAFERGERVFEITGGQQHIAATAHRQHCCFSGRASFDRSGHRHRIGDDKIVVLELLSE